MNTKPGAEQIAAEIRQGYADNGGHGAVDALAPHLAETILVWHVPAIPADGTMTRDFVLRARRLEVDSFAMAMPDYRETGEIAVEGNDILHDMVVSGTYRAAPLNITLHCRWTVEDGRIVKMGSYIDEQSPTFLEIFRGNPEFVAFAAGIAGR